MEQGILVVDVNVSDFQCFCSISGHENASLRVAGVKLSQLVKNIRSVGRRTAISVKHKFGMARLIDMKIFDEFARF